MTDIDKLAHGIFEIATGSSALYEQEYEAVENIKNVLSFYGDECAKQTWQPIETAPKDGTIFDVYLGNAEPEDVAFYCTEGTRRSSGWWWFQGKFRPKAGLAHCLCFIEPTHWMPLPHPPTPSEKVKP